MTTANKVLEAWERLTGYTPKQAGNEYRGISPLRMDADNKTAFVLTIEDGEHGAWTDYPGNESGSLYDLAQRLNVPLPEVSEVGSTLRKYGSVEDYAQAHGVEGSVFEKAGWQYHEFHPKYKRPCLSFPTTNGTRYRFTDGRKPKYINPDGYKSCWYGLDRALGMLKTFDHGEATPLVICNGESSTIVAQHYNVPAACVTGGERALPQAQVDELNALWQGPVLITMDCDDTGIRAAEAIHEQLPNSKVVDLQLSHNGDLGDFCALFGKQSMSELMKRYKKLLRNDDVEVGSLTGELREFIRGYKVPLGTSVVIPFKSFHRLGGFAHIMPPGKLACIVAPSGGGKTTFYETWNDLLEMRGLHGFYYGPEWTALEMLQRRIQRYGGPTYNQFELQRNYLRDQARGVPPEQAEGAMLTAEEMDKANRIMDQIEKWPGSTVMFKPTTHLEDILKRMERRIERMRETGKDVTYVMFDYAQILMSQDAMKSGNPYEYAVGLIKDFVMQQNIVGFVGSQVTKTATGEAMENKTIGAHQAAWITEQKFNLFITLRIVQHHNADGTYTPTNKGVAEVVKNNTGMKAPVRLKTAFEYLAWRDETW